MRQRLDVLHQGRPAATPRSKTRGCLNARPGRAPVDLAGQRRFLAGQEPRRRVDELDADAVQAGRGPLGQRRGESLVQPRVAMQVQDRAVGADRLGGQLQAVQDQVRRVPQQGLVLVAGRLALRAVADHDGPSPLAGHGRQLAVHGKGGAAPAGQAGRLDAGDQQPRAAAVGEPAEPGQVRRQGRRRARLGGQQPGQPVLGGRPPWRVPRRPGPRWRRVGCESIGCGPPGGGRTGSARPLAAAGWCWQS